MFSIVAYPQTPEWWGTLVNWDGVTHWSRYMKFSPRYMGVNALPIPAIGNGNVDSTNWIGITGNAHFSKGDDSQNLVVGANYAVVRNRVSIDANWIPIEWFNMSHSIKEQQNVYWKDYYLKRAVGDVHLNVNIQLLNSIKRHVQLALRIGYRYASSGGVGAARMTNMPGYYFDLSTGKRFRKQSRWKWIAMVGFYVWQTNDDRPRFYQNDALLSGLGAEFNNNLFRLQSYLAGYFGYNGGGDDPVVWRLNLERKVGGINIVLRYQQGLNDIYYSSFETGIKLNMPR